MNNPQFEINKTQKLSVIHSLSKINNLVRNNLYRKALQFIKNFKNGQKVIIQLKKFYLQNKK